MNLCKNISLEDIIKFINITFNDDSGIDQENKNVNESNKLSIYNNENVTFLNKKLQYLFQNFYFNKIKIDQFIEPEKIYNISIYICIFLCLKDNHILFFEKDKYFHIKGAIFNIIKKINNGYLKKIKLYNKNKNIQFYNEVLINDIKLYNITYDLIYILACYFDINIILVDNVENNITIFNTINNNINNNIKNNINKNTNMEDDFIYILLFKSYNNSFELMSINNTNIFHKNDDIIIHLFSKVDNDLVNLFNNTKNNKYNDNDTNNKHISNDYDIFIKNKQLNDVSEDTFDLKNTDNLSNINIDKNTYDIVKFDKKTLCKMKIKELHEIASNINISIYVDGKKIKKSIIIDKIIDNNTK